MPHTAPFARFFARFGARVMRGWVAVVLLAVGWSAQASGVALQALPEGSLGKHALVLVEAPGAPLDLGQAMARKAQFQPGATEILSFGIGASPVWIRLPITNAEAQARAMQLVTGAPWTDRIDVLLVQDGRVLASAQTGDERPGARGLQPGVGYVSALEIPPGQSELWVRVDCVDPMVVPLELMSAAQLMQHKEGAAYQYGIHYGFLVALCAYNLLLFVGLRERSYLSYAAYLASYIGVNLCYTGHGSAWFWPELPLFQRYVIPVMMVAFGATGLLFARRFLRLKTTAPTIDRSVRVLVTLGFSVVALGVLFGSHFAAVWWGFFYLGLVCAVMVGLGVLSWRKNVPSAPYFLGASLAGMLGAASSTFTTWGWVPFTELGYRAVEIGVTVEATLLALALAYQMRHYQRISLEASALARIDPLTQVLNRRALFEDATPAWRTADRGDRPISVIMVDLDYFKMINDRHGHEVGDRALVAVARALTEGRRAGDLLARWGGEEFVLVLPETDVTQALVLAESLRKSIGALSLPGAGGPLSLSASFGVAQRRSHASVESLIADADVQLLAAKREGRNRVCAAPMA